MKDQIRAALKSNRYNLTHLADNMGYSLTHLSNVLNKKNKASKPFIFLLCATVNNMTGSTFTTNDFQEYMK